MIFESKINIKTK